MTSTCKKLVAPHLEQSHPEGNKLTVWVLVFLAGFRRSFWSSGRQVEREENAFFFSSRPTFFVSVDGLLLAERQLVVSSCRLAADSRGRVRRLCVILPGGIPSSIINIPKTSDGSTLFYFYMLFFLQMASSQSAVECCFFLGLRADLPSKF